MIIATHKEIDKQTIGLTNYKHIIIYRDYADSDIILREGADFDDFIRPLGVIVLPYNSLERNLKYIYQDAYRKGREDAINQMLHP